MSQTDKQREPCNPHIPKISQIFNIKAYTRMRQSGIKTDPCSPNMQKYTNYSI